MCIFLSYFGTRLDGIQTAIPQDFEFKLAHPTIELTHLFKGFPAGVYKPLTFGSLFCQIKAVFIRSNFDIIGNICSENN